MRRVFSFPRLTLCFLFAISFVLTGRASGHIFTSRSSPIGFAAPQATVLTPRVRISPFAVFNDELNQKTITLEVRDPDPRIRSVVALYSSQDQASLNGTVSLFDDGTNGDAVAGDSTWTTQLQFSSAAPNLGHYGNSIATIVFQVSTRDKQGTTLVNYLLQLGVVDRAKAIAPRLVAPDIQAGDFAVNVVLDPSLFESGVSNSIPSDMVLTLAKRFYQSFPDAFDYFTVFSGGELLGYSFGVSSHVRNDTSGVNLDQVDFSSRYTTQGRLQMLIYMGQNSTATSFIHEVGHRWCAFMNDPRLNLDLPHSDGAAHFGTSDVVGQMRNGYNLSDNGNKTYTVQINNRIEKPYADLELYMMGLVPPEAVLPHRFILTSGVDPSLGSIVPASQTDLVKMDRIVEIYGARDPSAATSQKSFRSAFVTASPSLLNAAEMTLTDVVARHHGSSAALLPINFAMATKSLGKIETRIVQEAFPEITWADVKGKRLLVFGGNFSDSATILINGQPQATKNDPASPRSGVISKKAGKTISSGQTVTLQVLNADGKLTPEFRFTKP